MNSCHLATTLTSFRLLVRIRRWQGAVEFELEGIGIDSDGNEFEESAFAEARLFRVHLKLERELQQRRYAISMGLDIVPRN